MSTCLCLAIHSLSVVFTWTTYQDYPWAHTAEWGCICNIAILQWHCLTSKTQTMQQEHEIHMCTYKHTHTCKHNQPLTHMHTHTETYSCVSNIMLSSAMRHPKKQHFNPSQACLQHSHWHTQDNAPNTPSSCITSSCRCLWCTTGLLAWLNSVFLS